MLFSPAVSSVNLFTREISLKLVYYGPGLGGKTSSLQFIHRALKPDSRGQLVSLATGIDRTLYFDFLPLKLPKLRGYSIRVQLYTVPGQVHYNSTRKLVLAGADGVVFVADSQRAREEANVESFENLRENLVEQGQKIGEVPLAFQYNKRDAPDVLTVAELDARLNAARAPVFETVATDGRGLFETLKAITALVLNELRRRGIWDGGTTEKTTPATKFDRDEDSIAQRLKVLSEAAENSRVPEAPKVTPPPRVHTPPSMLASPIQMPMASEHVPRSASLAELLSPGDARDAVVLVEEKLARGDFAEAVRLAARAFAQGAASSSDGEGEDAALLHALLLGLPGERYLRFREAASRAQGGGSSSTDALFALFFLVDAALRT